MGLWINQGSESFAGVPTSYALTATRPLRDIAPPETLRQLSIGTQITRYAPVPGSSVDREERVSYARALERLKTQSGLFTESVGTIEFVSPTLFRASLVLPADLPVGQHTARAYLFREGVFLSQRDEALRVIKSGLENQVSRFAVQNGVLYGVFAVLIAVLTGWFGRLLFKRD